MKYINEDLLKLGVKEGDEISFQPDSEYEFNIDGEKHEACPPDLLFRFLHPRRHK